MICNLYSMSRNKDYSIYLVFPSNINNLHTAVWFQTTTTTTTTSSKRLNISFLPIDGTITVTTTQGQCRPGSNGNEVVLHISKRSRIRKKTRKYNSDFSSFIRSGSVLLQQKCSAVVFHFWRGLELFDRPSTNVLKFFNTFDVESNSRCPNTHYKWGRDATSVHITLKFWILCNVLLGSPSSFKYPVLQFLEYFISSKT